jgi:hypothetical protein
MGLVGQGSNREFADQLGRVVERDRSRRSALPLDGARFQRGRRPADLAGVIEVVLASAGVLRAADIHSGVEAVTGERVPVSSVKNWLARSARDTSSVVERVERGRYRLRG